MWRNFFNVALRNIGKNRIFSFINIAGLAIGLASAILIILFIAREISYDRFNEKSDQIYRAYIDGNMGEQKFRGAWTSYALAPTVTQKIEEVVDYVRLEVYPQQLVWHNDVKLIEDNVMFADSSFFNIFSINLLYGNPETVLSEPYSLVLSRTKALQYFGTEDPVGQKLEFNDEENFYTVRGVMDEFPDNSHFFADILLSMSTLEESRSENWLSNSIYSYLLLKKDADYTVVEEKINAILLEQIRGDLKDILDVTAEEWIQGGNAYNIYLQPLTNIHLNPDIETGSETCLRPVNDRSYIYIFSLIAFFILVIASINFMNLSTARSSIRAREIGMRKVVGCQKKALVWQFLIESLLLSMLALVLALLIVEICLPWFNRSMGLLLDFKSLGKGTILTIIFLLTILIGFISGIYPAFYLSGYKPLVGLRGGSLGGKRSMLFRSIMVTFQFIISIAIIVGTLIVTKQVRYLLNMDPGFKIRNMVVIDRVYPLENNIDVFCEEVEKIPGVIAASNSSTYLGFSNLTTSFQVKGRDPSKNYMMDVNFVDGDFLEAYGLNIEEGLGRFFTEKKPSDTMAVILNMAAVRKYDFEDPLNTVIQNPVGDGTILEYRVIGVVDDFHHSSLRKEISPYMFMNKTTYNSNSGYISIRFDNVQKFTGEVLKKINAVWNKLTVDEPFQYFFLEEELHNYYREEARTGKISFLFSFLAIVIACLGLLGLTIFNTERRLREIAIRKAMGANLRNILLIISGEILQLLGISIIIAWIIAFFFMKNWLQVFPYNIGFTPGVYLLAALAAVVIAMIAVNIITIRAAHSNPVDALYHE